MGVVKYRGAVKKLGPIGLGRKFVSFKIASGERRFTVHEDLLCARSKYFKRRLQKDRKAANGECSICFEELKAEIDDVTFCRSGCGQNIHEKCMDEWKRSRQGPPTCPMCRKLWKIKPEGVLMVGDGRYAAPLDRDAVQLYVNWLYSGHLNIDEEVDRADQDFNLLLIKAWVFSDKVKDDDFRYAIIAEWVSSMESDDNTAFDQACVEHIYLPENRISSMREFVVDAFLANYEADHLHDVLGDFPAGFTQDLCVAAIKLLKKGISRKDLVKEHTNGTFELEEDSDDGDFEDDDGEDDDGEDDEDGEDEEEDEEEV